MVKGTLIVNGARTPNSARKTNGARWTEWRTRGLTMITMITMIYYDEIFEQTGLFRAICSNFVIFTP